MTYLAPLRIRLIAALLDQLIFYVLLTFFVLGFPEMMDDDMDDWKFFFTIVGLWVFYYPLAESISGQTIGKKLFRIKVIKEDGKAVVFGDTIVRRVMDLIDFLFLGLVGVLIANSNQKKQRMGDMLAKTIVVNESVTSCARCGSPLTLQRDSIDGGMLKCPTCGHQISLSMPRSSENVPPK